MPKVQVNIKIVIIIGLFLSILLGVLFYFNAKNVNSDISQSTNEISKQATSKFSDQINNTSEKVDIIFNYKKYINRDYNISFSYPSSWYIKQTEKINLKSIEGYHIYNVILGDSKISVDIKYYYHDNRDYIKNPVKPETDFYPEPFGVGYEKDDFECSNEYCVSTLGASNLFISDDSNYFLEGRNLDYREQSYLYQLYDGRLYANTTIFHNYLNSQPGHLYFKTIITYQIDEENNSDLLWQTYKKDLLDLAKNASN